jgi:hypothetical protein
MNIVTRGALIDGDPSGTSTEVVVPSKAMDEHLFAERPYLDCQATAIFTGPGDATCPSCGLRMYFTASGRVGRYPSEGWTPGGIEGLRQG